MVVYFSTYANPIYITLPITYFHVVFQLLFSCCRSAELQVSCTLIKKTFLILQGRGCTHLQVGWSSIVGRIYTFVGRKHSFVGNYTFFRSDGHRLQVEDLYICRSETFICMSDIHICRSDGHQLQVGWSSIEGYTHLQVGWSSIVGRIYTFSRSNGHYLQVGWSSVVGRIHAFVGRMYTFVWSDGHRIVQVRFTLLQVGCTNLQV